MWCPHCLARPSTRRTSRTRSWLLRMRCSPAATCVAVARYRARVGSLLSGGKGLCTMFSVGRVVCLLCGGGGFLCVLLSGGGSFSTALIDRWVRIRTLLLSSSHPCGLPCVPSRPRPLFELYHWLTSPFRCVVLANCCARCSCTRQSSGGLTSRWRPAGKVLESSSVATRYAVSC